jgi:hypothetical protein
MIDYHQIKCGTPVCNAERRTGVIEHVYTGALAGAVEVRWADGSMSTERSYTLRAPTATAYLPVSLWMSLY